MTYSTQVVKSSDHHKVSPRELVYVQQTQNFSKSTELKLPHIDSSWYPCLSCRARCRCYTSTYQWRAQYRLGILVAGARQRHSMILHTCTYHHTRCPVQRRHMIAFQSFLTLKIRIEHNITIFLSSQNLLKIWELCSSLITSWGSFTSDADVRPTSPAIRLKVFITLT